MSTRTTIRLELGLLLALGLFLLNAACAAFGDSSTLGLPTLENQQQNGSTAVDDGDDGTVDDSDNNMPMTGAVTTEVIATSSAGGHTVSMEVEVDHDSFGVTCTHDHGIGPVESQCFGPVTARFPIDTENGAAEFNVEYFSSSPDSGDPALTEQIDVQVDVECGDMPLTSNLGLSSNQQLVASVPVGAGASDCNVAIIVIEARVGSTGLTTTVTQGVRVTARKTAPIECVTSNDCRPGMHICGPNGECTTGKEGQPGVVKALHCDTLFVNEFGCSDGDAGSFARGAFECAPGYTFNGFECLGEPCINSAGCPPERPVCTDRGCSETGLRGDGANQGFGCESGLALNSVCQEIAEQGEDCSDPNVVCAGGLRCFLFLTCEVPLPLGSACDANRECAGFPGSHSCIQGTCAFLSGPSGPCDVNGTSGDNADCFNLSCDPTPPGTCSP